MAIENSRLISIGEYDIVVFQTFTMYCCLVGSALNLRLSKGFKT